jgi:hypothetical protein
MLEFSTRLGELRMHLEHEVPVGRRFLEIDIRSALDLVSFVWFLLCDAFLLVWVVSLFWFSLVYILGFYLLPPALKQDTALKTGSLGL